jgi:purine-binding chemotaxis protein CheW
MSGDSAQERAATAAAAATANTNTASPPPLRYGGFTIGGMQLALPMAALREVVPCGPLTRLPCPAACVVGGIQLRGVMVPVVDLRIVLGLPLSDGEFRSVIIMVHGGHILGLLAEGVSGVFTSAAVQQHPVHANDPVAALLSATVPSDDDGTLVSVLSPDAIASLHQVPLVRDPEPARQQLDTSVDLVDTTDTAVPVMLMRCGQTALAIDAQAVHATLAAPKVERGVLSQGVCRGCIDYAGQKVPAIDLMAWCGLGTLDSPPEQLQAFVVSLDHGMVAFLIDSVIDVVRTQPTDVIALPRFALPRAPLFAGTLPLSGLASDAATNEQSFGPNPPAHYLLLSSHALRDDAEVAALSHTNTPSGSAALSADARAFSAGVAAGAGRRSMVTYALDREAATPLAQLTEILPWSPALTRVSHGGPMLGILVNRGRSIAVMCLSQLVLGRPAEATAATSLLVIESQGELLGFAVPSLKTIESADWEPELPSHTGTDAALATLTATPARKLALVGSGATERMLPVLDLHAIARGLQAQAQV